MVLRTTSTSLKRTGRCLALGLVCVAAGCATKKAATHNYAFFPPPPDEPRIQYLTSFGSEADLGGQSKLSEFVLGQDKVHRPIWKPYGIAVRAGTVYVCDTQAGNVGVVDLVKRRIRFHRPEAQAAMKMPINLAVDEEGTRYVTDTVRGQVLIYGADNSYLGEMGKSGEMKPCGIAIAGEKLYVTDLSNHCVRVYQKASRELLFTVPHDRTDEKGKLFSPTNVAVDEQGNMYVSDTGGFNVKLYDAQGNHLRTIGDVGLSPGQFALPKGIGVDRQGRIYVVDAATALAQVFDKEGRLLMYFGEPKTSGPAAMYLPAGLSIDYENTNVFRKFVAPGYGLDFLIFVTNQAGPNKVSVYGFLRKS